MTKFQQLIDLPIFDLNSELNMLLKEGIVNWSEDNQICLNSTIEDPNNFYLGSGSLAYDWDNKKITIDEYGNEKIEVFESKKKYCEEDFSVLCKVFKNTKFEIVYNELKNRYNIGRIRLMKSKPKTCLSWHVDTSIRIHYPVKTQEGCFMVIDGEVKHLPQNTWWQTNTVLPHTAFNASKEDRIHLVTVVLDKK